jgi:hypothetical protein
VVQSAIITAVLWNIWKARNNVVFIDTYSPAAVILWYVASDLDLWASKGKKPLDSVVLRMWAHSVVT